MKILLTGATGFIGHNLVKKLLNSGYIVYCIVRSGSNISNIDKNANLFIYDGDIDSIISFCKEKKFDGIIHLASFFLSSHKKEDLCGLIESNIKFGTELLEAAKITDVKWFINTGTFWQNYNNEKYNPVNLYSATKEAFLCIAKYYTQTSNLIFTTIKLNDTFGINDTRNKIINMWQKASKTSETIEMTPGEQIIDISYIEDVVSAYELLIKHLNSKKKEQYKNTEFVVTNSDKCSLKELAKIFEKEIDGRLNIKWGARTYREREIMVPYNKGLTVPGWRQKYTLKEAIAKVIKDGN